MMPMKQISAMSRILLLLSVSAAMFHIAFFSSFLLIHLLFHLLVLLPCFLKCLPSAQLLAFTFGFSFVLPSNPLIYPFPLNPSSQLSL